MTIKTDTIAEYTDAAGVTIDGVLIKDGNVDGADVSALATASHAAVTLDVNANTLLSLSTQALGLDTQAANRVLSGPASGTAVVPTFRALVSDDIPSLDHGAKLTGLSDDDHAQYLLATGARAGSSSQAQDFGALGIKANVLAESTTAAGVTVDSVLLKDGTGTFYASSGSQLTLQQAAGVTATFAVDSVGNLNITPSGRGVFAKAMHLGSGGVSGSNNEILSVFQYYDNTQMATNPVAIEVHARWDEATNINYDMYAGQFQAQAWGAATIKGVYGLEAQASTQGPSTVTALTGLRALATTGFAGSTVQTMTGAYITAGDILGVTTGSMYGANIAVAAKGTPATVIGVNSDLQPYTGCAITNAYGFKTDIYSHSLLAGSITNYYGVRVDALPTYPAIANAYGLYIGDMTGADVLNYAIYTGAGAHRLGDSTATVGFYGATPVARATTAGAAAAFTANSGTAVNDASTFGGYTLKQIAQALQNIGILT